MRSSRGTGRGGRTQLRYLRETREMHVCHAAPACEQRPHVPARLRLMQLAECPTHLRDVEILTDVGGDHEKQAAVGSAFVQLTRRVEIARADAERRRAA